MSSYNKVLKATTTYGIVQLIIIIISALQLKTIAVLLGPSGMGIMNMLSTTLAFVGGILSFGIGTSAIRNVAEADNNNKTLLNDTITIIIRLAWLSSFLGVMLLLTISSWLNKILFGNADNGVSIYWLIPILIFNQVYSIKRAILQGLRDVKSLTKLNLIGTFVSLIVSIPLYYFFNINGIVIALALSSFSNFLLANYFLRKKFLIYSRLKLIDSIIISKRILSLGIASNFVEIFTQAKSFLLRILISNEGGIHQVGMYSGGFAIINGYIGMIFTAMSMDYYPRLAGVSGDANTINKTINEQAEISIIILSPLIVFFQIFINLIIQLLYSNEFLNISSMLLWASIGIFPKAASWANAFLFLAKGNPKDYLINELIGGSISFVLTIFLYFRFGLSGIGIGFTMGYLLYMIIVFFTTHRKFGFVWNKYFLIFSSVQYSLIILSFIIIYNSTLKQIQWICLPIFTLSLMCSLYVLNKRINISKVLFNLYAKS